MSPALKFGDVVAFRPDPSTLRAYGTKFMAIVVSDGGDFSTNEDVATVVCLKADGEWEPGMVSYRHANLFIVLEEV